LPDPDYTGSKTVFIILLTQTFAASTNQEIDDFFFKRLTQPLLSQISLIYETASLEELKAIPKSAYGKCFEDWKNRWHKCIVSKGDYFEGDNINIDK